MKTLLELEITPREDRLLKEMLAAMNISFSSQFVENSPEIVFEKGGSETEIRESVQKCFGMWKNRQDFNDFQDFRQQAWGGRGV